MIDDATINIPGILAVQPYVIHILPKAQDWNDFGTYAPAIPGIIVALLGLWIAHRLSVRRDRRKEILELCEDVKSAVGEAEQASARAWLTARGPERLPAVHDAKSKLQMLGIMATDLHRRTMRGSLGSLKCLFTDSPMSINVIGEIAQLRDIATADPFEDPRRSLNRRPIDDIAAVAAEIHARINYQFQSLYP